MTASPKNLRILIVTPAFNEAEALPKFLGEFFVLRTALLPQVALRLLVSDDGSTDNTRAVLETACREHPEEVSFLSFSGNFGHQSALIAGLVSGSRWADAIVTMDCDLEHPFAVVPQMIELWKKERPVLVNTTRISHKGLPWRKRAFSSLFYFFTAKITGLPLQSGQADFRLWDGAVLRSLAEYLPGIQSLRVLAAWIPGKKCSIQYEQALIEGRETRFGFRKNLDLALIGIIRFSTAPLKAILLLGVLGLAIAGSYGGYVVYQAIHGAVVPGWASTILTILIMGSLNLISIGILAGYLQRLVFAKDLPPFLVQTREGFLERD